MTHRDKVMQAIEQTEYYKRNSLYFRYSDWHFLSPDSLEPLFTVENKYDIVSK